MASKIVPRSNPRGLRVKFPRTNREIADQAFGRDPHRPPGPPLTPEEEDEINNEEVLGRGSGDILGGVRTTGPGAHVPPGSVAEMLTKMGVDLLGPVDQLFNLIGPMSQRAPGGLGSLLTPKPQIGGGL